jgi:ABC-2 type transport system ATP-binding protein
VVAHPALAKQILGIVSQQNTLDRQLTVWENLYFHGRLFGIPARESRRTATELLEQFQLERWSGASVYALSGGMAQRLMVARAIFHRPAVLFLDEPTAGLDPRSRRTMWQVIRDLVDRGVTIFLTTQYLEEADRLADRIAVLDRGRLVAEGTPSELKRRVPGGHVRLEFADASELERAASTFRGSSRDDESLALLVPSDGGVGSLRALLDELDRASIDVDGLSVRTPDLDDVFLSLTDRTDTHEGAA